MRWSVATLDWQGGSQHRAPVHENGDTQAARVPVQDHRPHGNHELFPSRGPARQFHHTARQRLWRQPGAHPPTGLTPPAPLATRAARAAIAPGSPRPDWARDRVGIFPFVDPHPRRLRWRRSGLMPPSPSRTTTGIRMRLDVQIGGIADASRKRPAVANHAIRARRFHVSPIACRVPAVEACLGTAVADSVRPDPGTQHERLVWRRRRQREAE